MAFSPSRPDKQKTFGGGYDLRRQTQASAQALADGSSRALRLDPLGLPVRYVTEDESADGHSRIVDIDHNRVLLLRSVSGVRMRLRIPLDGFLGVAVRILIADKNDPCAAAITLEHRDPALSVALHIANDFDDIAAEWQLWGRVLGRPLLVADPDGTLREPLKMLGALMVDEGTKRRRRRTPLRKRRPYFSARRKGFSVRLVTVVHRGEREIIARS